MLSAPNPNLSMSQNTHFPEHIPHIHSPLVRSFPTHAMLANRPRDRQPEAAHASSPTGPSPKDSAAATGPSILGGFCLFRRRFEPIVVPSTMRVGGSCFRAWIPSQFIRNRRIVDDANGQDGGPDDWRPQCRAVALSSKPHPQSTPDVTRAVIPTDRPRNHDRTSSAREPATPRSPPRDVPRAPCGLLLLANDARGITLGGRGAASRPRQHKV
ncbi:uncharacterized protein K489DRAFT_170170 [Dissoconium aciculare CBS 342.82]|uniref:Uncharacterized protein n=1 Tax=Dissoconium aciculare CBS 342.82 TaxID=1314786 RepID=A0A6J3M7C5_9PEZI|nr:uncharacterized protein K489DRAFT_170170 [Dissoconium aciculare CBS 342.82]KAF1823966.1 hypothetical protein K489DRAFT_170170 [Dissoconium aciculare CBS 342.82]